MMTEESRGKRRKQANPRRNRGKEACGAETKVSRSWIGDAADGEALARTERARSTVGPQTDTYCVMTTQQVDYIDSCFIIFFASTTCQLQGSLILSFSLSGCIHWDYSIPVHTHTHIHTHMHTHF